MSDSKKNKLDELAADWEAEDGTDANKNSNEALAHEDSELGDMGIENYPPPRRRPSLQQESVSEPSDELVTIIDDPFQMPDLNSSDEELDRLEGAMQAEHERNLKELESIALEATETESATIDLEEQIAEDKALELQIQSEIEALKQTEFSPENVSSLPTRDPDTGLYDLTEVQSCCEALLFLSDRPVSAKKLQEWLSPSPATGPTTDEADTSETTPARKAKKSDLIPIEQIEEACSVIRARFENIPGHGISLMEVAGGYQFRTKPNRAELAKRIAKVQTQRLSRGAMETLAIVAYKQPVLKEEIDRIRGVDSSHFIRTLMDKKLVEMTGRSEQVGKPILYGTTTEFLEIFGLKDLTSMPPLRELEEMIPQSETGAEHVDPRIQQMRKLVGEMKSDRTRLQYDPSDDEKFLSEIRERVKSIPISTSTLDEMAAEKAAEKEAAKKSGEKPFPEKLL